MKIFLAALESNMEDTLDVLENDFVEFGLTSYFYLQNKEDKVDYILPKVKQLLVDSGAHSFQHGTKVDFDEFTNDYIEFIKKYDKDEKILGFFEMDIDNVVGYEKVKYYREKLEEVSNKIIPVWHQNRGVDDFIEMCKSYSGKRIAITGFKNNDIIDSQYNLFLNTAHKYNCNVHILGMTRFDLMESLNLHKEDSVDSSSWKQSAIFGNVNLLDSDERLNNLSFANGLKIHWKHLMMLNLLSYVQIQKYFKEIDRSIYKTTQGDNIK